MPILLSLLAKRLPIPHKSFNSKESIKSITSFSLTKQYPSGLNTVDASFAINLFGPIPIEHVMLNFSFIYAFTT